MATLRDDLLRAGAYPTAPEAPIELIETHISLVFLVEGDVFKVKKPLNLGFLDFSTLARRRRACEAEVALNGRLAPDVYVGVVPIVRGADSVHRVGGEGRVVDVAVHMKRLAEETRADAILARGELSIERLEALARKLALFHGAARCDAETARYGRVAAIARAIDENFVQTGDASADVLDPAARDTIERYQRAFLRRSADIIATRAEGRVRDGHGDLRLEHVYFGRDDVLRIIDCIEFNERFRYADVAADIAFLSMDLAYEGHPELGEAFLAAYAIESNDYGLYEVVDFYQTYRAFVRGKVSLFLAQDRDAAAEVRAHAAVRARRYFELAASLATRAPALPVVIAVGGLLASGKSTVAHALGVKLAAAVVGSDRTRKHLARLAPTTPMAEPAWQGAYSLHATEHVYAEVLARADVVLRSGRSVILDASFRSTAQRARARALAQTRGASFVFIECCASLDVLRERLRGRDAARDRSEVVSDGSLGLLDDFVARWEPVVELAPEEHVILDTTEDLARGLERLEVERRLERARRAA